MGRPRGLVASVAAALGLWLVTGPMGAGASAISAAPPGSSGYDVSWPQCHAPLPGDGGFAVVGVTDGVPWTVNPCLADEFQWAAAKSYAAALYINTSNPGPISPHWALPGPASCRDLSSAADSGCAYNDGWNAAAHAFTVAGSAIPSAAGLWWWLDVETVNSWNGGIAANAANLQGSIDYLRTQHVPGIGIYSSGSQWDVITGGYRPASTGGSTIADWVAGALDLTQAATFCDPSHAFSGGPVVLAQWVGFDDADYVCQLPPRAKQTARSSPRKPRSARAIVPAPRP